MLDAVIGLGSNLGDSRMLLRQALQSIAALGTVLAESPVYETLPVGPPQPLFQNAACRLHSGLSPEGLLSGLLEIERALGRVRRERWGPRLIDLDILWIAGLVLDTPALTVPHPELRNRAFALCPLLDVAPEATDPRDGVRYAAVLAELGRGSVRKVS